MIEVKTPVLVQWRIPGLFYSINQRFYCRWENIHLDPFSITFDLGKMKQPLLLNYFLRIKVKRRGCCRPCSRYSSELHGSHGQTHRTNVWHRYHRRRWNWCCSPLTMNTLVLSGCYSFRKRRECWLTKQRVIKVNCFNTQRRFFWKTRSSAWSVRIP